MMNTFVALLFLFGLVAVGFAHLYAPGSSPLTNFRHRRAERQLDQDGQQLVTEVERFLADRSC